MHLGNAARARAQGHKKIGFLDSDNNISTFNNENVVNNIKESKSNVNVSTNGKGNLKAITTCEVPNLKCKSYFNK